MKLIDLVNEAVDASGVEDKQEAKLSEIWDEQGSNSASFVPRQQFAVKKIGNEYEVNLINNSQRKFFKKISDEELQTSYSQVGKEPDAEGYTSYVLKSIVDAFSYDGESVMIKNGNSEASLMKGDYVVKRPKKTGFEFLVVEKNEFESKYVERT